MFNKFEPTEKLKPGVCRFCYGMRVGVETRGDDHMACCQTCGFTERVDWTEVAKDWPRDMLTDEQLAEVDGKQGDGR